MRGTQGNTSGKHHTREQQSVNEKATSENGKSNVAQNPSHQRHNIHRKAEG